MVAFEKLGGRLFTGPTAVQSGVLYPGSPALGSRFASPARISGTASPLSRARGAP